MEYDNTVEKELVARGAPAECYVISNDPEYDARTMPLQEAVDETIYGYGMEGAVLLCVPGRLAFYRGEVVDGGGYEWIIERPA